MFEKIYLKDSNLRPHLEAPFLKEREDFVSRMEGRGYCVRCQQMVASYLLFAVKYLGLKDNDRSPVALMPIWEMGQAYLQKRLASKRRKNSSPDVDTKYVDQIHYTITWLKEIGMLDEQYNDSSVILNQLMVKDFYKLKHLVSPLLAERLSYLQHLHDTGYERTTIREAAEMQLVVIEMLNLTSHRPVHADEVNNAFVKWDSIERGHHRPHAARSRTKFFNVAFNWLRHAGMLVEERKTVHEKGKIDSYSHWLLYEKGLSMATISRRVMELTHLTEYLHSLNKSIGDLSPAVVDGYISQRSKDGCNRRSISTIVTGLRDFLRYASICQWTNHDFSGSIRGPRLFPHEGIPYAPEWDEVKRLVGYYDGKDSVSIRNHAVMLLLAVYGLRTSEVAELKLGDIDWENDTMVINHKKRGRSMLYPLFPEVGNAIVRYLREARNNDIDDRHLFLTTMAPYHGVSRSIIYLIVANAYKGIGVSVKHIGGHSLRHACASMLVNTGHTLKTVSDVLGHRSLDSTREYAKMDLASLSVVAEMNWEGLI